MDLSSLVEMVNMAHYYFVHGFLDRRFFQFGFGTIDLVSLDFRNSFHWDFYYYCRVKFWKNYKN